jgi:hypothetical protein
MRLSLLSRLGGLVVASALCAVAAAPAPASALMLSPGFDTSKAGRCDFLDPSVCLYPFPNDHFTIADPTTDTGRRINFDIQSMPRNVAGKPVDPSDYWRNDGFSPGSMMITKVPGLDSQAAFDASGLVPLTNMARAFDPDQAAVLINTRTLERQLIWAEVDANPADAADKTLIIRPGANLEEGTRYIVALRHLRKASGTIIPAGAAFRTYRDKIITTDLAVEGRRAHMESIFATLQAAGIARNDLFLAWDFTVASERNLSERFLRMRDDAFAKLGDTNLADLTVQGKSPTFVVNPDTPDSLDGQTLDTSPIPDLGLPVGPGDVADLADPANYDGVRNFAPCGTDGCQNGESDTVARRVIGEVLVPCYLNLPGCPPSSRFAFASITGNAPLAIPGNIAVANFICNIPRSAIDADGTLHPARVSLYGHGLLGGAGEVNAGNVQRMGNEHDIVFCATDWKGMATEDVPNVATILLDVSNFPTLADRVQQGMLNFLYLGRTMIHPDGFPASPAFKFGGRSVIDARRLFYDGNSQGGIIGGALTAVAPDFNRSVLGVPGMNYSTLLRRSSDFGTYSGVLYQAYPDELQRPLLLALMQMLWDRAEADGYALHMTSDPLPNTPAHTVLMHEAYGDHQVSNYAAQVEARTIGAWIHSPVLDPLRAPLFSDYAYGIPRIDSYPFGGSALVIWDSGPPRAGDSGVFDPPVTNTFPTQGRDPHSDPRSEVLAREQKSQFLATDGKVVDVCPGRPCYAHGWTGP